MYLLHLVDEARERFWAVLCEGSEDLAINRNALILQRLHESAVLEALILEDRVQTNDPELAEDILLVSSVRERVELRVVDCLFRFLGLLGAAEAVSFYLFEDLSAPLIGGNSSFHS